MSSTNPTTSAAGDEASRLLIMGPPGAGKGTQGVVLAHHLGVPAISTGDMFRALLRTETPLAKRVRDIVTRGGYVDDDTTNAIVDDRLEAADCAHGFLLDGYPRTVSQVHHLDELLRQQDAQLDAVVSLEVDEDEIVHRLTVRGQTDDRDDDQADTIRARLSVYREQTAHLTEQYRSRGLLISVEATGTVDQVTERINCALSARS